MKKRIWNPLVYAEFAVFLGIGTLAGCGGEKTIDYHPEGVADVPQTGSGAGGAVSQFAGETLWSEIWNIERGGEETVEVIVDARIVLPPVEEMYVVTAKVPKFDEQFREQAVKNFYGESVVFYDDILHLPKKELEAIYKDYENRYETSSDAEKDIWKANMEKYKSLMEKASDTYTPADDYEVDEYIGTRDGITYKLGIHDDYGVAEGKFDSLEIVINATNIEELVPEQYPDYIHAWPHPYMTCDKYADIGENECVYSEQEAERLARDLLESFGLEYPVLTRSVPLIWGDEELSSRNCNEYHANGYSFTFAYGIDGVSFPDFGTEDNYENWDAIGVYQEKTVKYGMNAHAVIDVTDKGIYCEYIADPLETVRISECVKLLPLETIKEIMKENMEKKYEDLPFHAGRVPQKFTHMELIYFRVRDKENEGCYSYVPAWRLSEKEEMYSYGESRIRNPIIVNAIDGTLIDIYEDW